MREASEATLRRAAGVLQQGAAVTPGWEKYAERVGVQSDVDGTYAGLSEDDELAEQVFDWEYGTEEQAPTGFLRNTVTAHGADLSRQLTDDILGRLL